TRPPRSAASSWPPTAGPPASSATRPSASTTPANRPAPSAPRPSRPWSWRMATSSRRARPTPRSGATRSNPPPLVGGGGLRSRSEVGSLCFSAFARSFVAQRRWERDPTSVRHSADTSAHKGRRIRNSLRPRARPALRRGFLLSTPRPGQDRGQGVIPLVAGILVDDPMQRGEVVLAAPRLGPGVRVLDLEAVVDPGRRHPREPLGDL